ncbi:hypothetical protein [Fimbriiglobus ruber]|uniref:Uncharacterized protein n=1 Tax=Fimbriiglobus ruber TaxID=1908690 RepID=A0A225E4J9_9BACT|nr:hypothetical protein [Fimbriiglobus ruber]OWK45728.1 hypothetical protein FRUB_02059 [Fimbriiglobus ruber]
MAEDQLPDHENDAPTACHHCGAGLPLVVDAFCPECRGRLDDPPPAPAEPGQPPEGGSGDPVRAYAGCLSIGGGLAALFVSVPAALRGNWPEVIATGGVGIVLAAGGVVWAARQRHAADNPEVSGDAPPARRRFSRKWFATTACLLVILVFVVVESFRRDDPPGILADVRGLSEPGDYRNPYFGFRVRYGADWRDATEETRRQAAGRPNSGSDRTAYLLALVWAPVADRNEASVLFAAEPVRRADPVDSGAEYLRRLLALLRRRPEPRARWRGSRRP